MTVTYVYGARVEWLLFQRDFQSRQLLWFELTFMVKNHVRYDTAQYKISVTQYRTFIHGFFSFIRAQDIDVSTWQEFDCRYQTHSSAMFNNFNSPLSVLFLKGLEVNVIESKQ
jgi:hypothetical protein